MSSDVPGSPGSPLAETALEINRQRNRSTRDAWDEFTTHRQISTSLIIDGTMQQDPETGSLAQSSEQRLCVLGAGNSNDLDAARICQRYSTIQLVDMDGEALEISAGKYQQAASGLARSIDLQCTVLDVTGLFKVSELKYGSSECESTECLQQPLSTDSSVEQILEQLSQCRLPIPAASFDCVASTCLLSQMVGSLQTLISERSPKFVSAVIAMRRRHLEQMIELLRPGGRGVLITDFVSSLTWPGLGSLTPQQLNQEAVRVIQQGNFFTGCNPLAIRVLLQGDSAFVTRINGVKLTPCWCWDLGGKQMAVAALTFVRAID